MLYLVKIRRRGKFKGLVNPCMELVDGKVFNFYKGWKITKDDNLLYLGETAMVIDDENYPRIPVRWIASGDLKKVN